jgi:hypothetical protein
MIARSVCGSGAFNYRDARTAQLIVEAYEKTDSNIPRLGRDLPNGVGTGAVHRELGKLAGSGLIAGSENDID